MAEEKQKSGVSILGALLGSVATLLLAFNTWQVSQFDKELRTTESNRELNFRMYTSITDAIESNNPQRIRAVRVLVESLATDDVRAGFLAALETGEVDIYKAEQALVSMPGTKERTVNWRDWDFDIFWCSSSGAEAEAKSVRFVQALKEDGAQGRVRSRILPDSVRAQAGYASVFGYQIRYEKSEEQQAQDLKRLAEEVFGTTDVYELHAITPENPTPWYVSVFVCPG